MFNKPKRIDIVPAISEAIFDDFFRWYNNENNMYLQMPETNIKDATCTNIALLEPSSFVTKAGIERIEYLFGGRSPIQGTARRMKALYAQLIVKYSLAVMNEFKTRCIESLSVAYHIDMETLNDLDTKYNTFWMFPMFKRAFENNVVNNKNID